VIAGRRSPHRSRAVIEQAIGILTERFAATEDAAFTVLSASHR
jgi:AmiR/NasT family two-component response regulator